jgi:hypothetical protein
MLHKKLNKSIQDFKRTVSLALHFKDLPLCINPLIPRIDNPPNPWAPPTNKEYTPLLDKCFTSIQTQAENALKSSKICYSPVDALIYKTLQRLHKDKSIVIKPADKNVGLVIMNKSDYKDMCMKHLNDRSVYLPIGYFNPNLHFAALRQILKRHNHLHSVIKQQKRLTKLATSLLHLQIFKDTTLRIAPFYCLPKIHKAVLPPPGRPICSSIMTLTHHASLYLDKVLQPLLKRIPTTCTSSSSVILDFCELEKVPSSSIILTGDVASLYPSIPIDAGIHAIREVCNDYNHCLDELPFIIDLLYFVLTHNFCTFNKQTYLQIQGTAMGTPVAVTYANIFLYHLERTLLIPAAPIYYRRFIDDIFAIMRPVSAQQFVNSFNTQHSTIKLESVTMNTIGIFLDVKFELIPSPDDINFYHIKHSIYQKAINIYQYIPYMSAHQPHTLYNFILNEFKRYSLLCSHEVDFQHTASLFTQRLQDRGYPLHLISKALSALPSRNDLLSYLKKKKPLLPKNASTTRRPIAIIDLPQLYPKPHWASIFSLDPLQHLKEYHKAYGNSNVMIAFRSLPNIANTITRSTFQ